MATVAGARVFLAANADDRTYDHEFGHILGLQHDIIYRTIYGYTAELANPNTVMGLRSPLAYQNAYKPTQLDIANVFKAYSGK